MSNDVSSEMSIHPQSTLSADGTTIAYEAYGSGPVVVHVGGAFNDRGAGRDLARAVAEHGRTGVCYDRRGRGDSGDTKPYAVEREIDDLVAVLRATAQDDAAHVHGVSSGGALVLRALAAGAPVATASVLEPPYRVAGAPPMPERYLETLEELEAQGDREGILRYFHTRAVGLPEEVLDGMRGTPMWDALLRLAYTVRHDGLCMGPESELPAAMLASIQTPVLAVSSSGTTLPFLPAAARAVAAALPRGEYLELPGGFHEVTAESLAAAIADFGRRAG
ncbi:alpha/beta hydrolase [Intrasporangium sp. DVR]|uniref:alpha/beta fold hydrolase n=1 Tax=Intrasporangium sp. DVR TaxID=3127867 RepID=UPI00313A708A